MTQTRESRPGQGAAPVVHDQTLDTPEGTSERGDLATLEEFDTELRDSGWMLDLERDDRGRATKAYSNFELIFEHDSVLRGLGVNEMGDELAWRELPPWKSPDSPRYLDDKDQARVDERLRSYFGATVTSLPKNLCQEVTVRFAAERPFSPWRDYLDGLPAWDGVQRLGAAIPDGCVVRTEYTEAVLTSFFLGMMARVYNPGCQMDSMLVLVGEQGYRKTSFFRALVPSQDMYAELGSVPDDRSGAGKDVLLKAHRAAVVLFDEINKLGRKADQEALKAFLTERVDSWRPPYGKHQGHHQRAFVVGATTNEEQFLLDTTGNRRYWPVRITDVIPEEALTRDRMDLLLAEARDRYREGERLDYGRAFEAVAEAERAQYVNDPVGEAVYGWIEQTEERNSRMRRDHGNDSPYLVEVDRLTVSYLVQHVPELQGVDVTKDKITTKAIRDAMDRHPDYRCCSGPVKFNGASTKKAWDRIA